MNRAASSSAYWSPSIVVMGVSGAGKTTTGILIAEALGLEFVDADSLHPPANLLKMAGGEPLTDEDRWPWLAEVGRTMALSADVGIVMACSALKRAYRDAIVRLAPDVRFIHLHSSAQLLAMRVEHRSGHFMPPGLLTSQLETLEPLAPDEHGVQVGVEGPIEDVVAQAISALESLAPINTPAEPIRQQCPERTG